ncbi:MAG: hypothetical protein V7785_08755 [Bermanella sp.]
MKSLISGSLILLALYAQSSFAQDSSHWVILNSHNQYFSEQVTSIQPTLLIPLSQSQYSLMAYTRVNRHQSANHTGVMQYRSSKSYGFGLHHRVSNWMHTQIVVQTQQYRSSASGFESMLNLAVQF